jgi:glutamate carboxypeptidase
MTTAAERRAEAAASWLSGKGPSMEEALVPLVEQNSFTDNPEGGRLVGARLRELFAMEGLTPAIVPSTRYADHLVFTADGDAAVPPIALVGHLDTVFPPGTFEGYRRDGDVARGPGVLDMKGGLVVAAFALKSLAETGGLGHLPPLRVVIVADEEVGSPEGQAVITKSIQGSSACLVFEAGRKGDAIITRRKGTGSVHAIAHGVAAHAGNQHEVGKNAIWALARFVDRAQGVTDYGRGVTVNVGKVSGGLGKNTVPDRADAWVDFRFCVAQDGIDVAAALERAGADAAASVPGTRIEVTGGVARQPLERTPKSAALMGRYGSCARAAGLGDGEAALLGGGSDASTSSSMGIPSIDGLGPRGTGFHTKEELIEVSSLVPKAQALARFLALEAEALRPG